MRNEQEVKSRLTDVGNETSTEAKFMHHLALASRYSIPSFSASTNQMSPRLGDVTVSLSTPSLSQRLLPTRFFRE
ncbi:uncharacterized protein G2W53_043808 [Senna tora]|uniref:Uncharacterized protein n=1 Tax=Senna tora TaxID=362788 RepID=A0A834W0I0_9FABA|nr:uncharacterized protein G2W53_043808 [Senna tora]